uniref:Uncharacterized protein n=1 Tax=Prolemur simus TaxID=1328070 RepID=A0A8C9AS91_PROSS
MEVGKVEVDSQEGPQEQGGLCESGKQQQNLNVWPQSRANGLPKHSYWSDSWLFILFNVVLFIFMYLLP